MDAFMLLQKIPFKLYKLYNFNSLQELVCPIIFATNLRHAGKIKLKQVINMISCDTNAQTEDYCYF